MKEKALAQQELLDALIKAIKQNEIAQVKELLEKVADVNIIVNKDGDTPLHIAASWGNTELVKLLLEKGADINTANNNGNTILHVAIFFRSTEVVKLLLEKEADINTANNNGDTPLRYAASWGNTELVKLLLEKGADINTANNKGDTLLHDTIFFRNTEVLKLLLESGADINTANNNGTTPLHSAIFKHNTEVVKLLLENGADVNKADGYGDTPLHGAALRRDTELVKLLLENGADINTANNNGITPLFKILSKTWLYEPLTWFKEQFSEDGLKEYNNIGKFELYRGLYYIKSHEELQTNYEVKEIANITYNEVNELSFMESIKGAFKDIRKDINSLSVYIPNNRGKILSKIKLTHDLINQFNNPKELKSIIKILNIDESIDGIKKDIRNSIQNADNDLKNNFFKYMRICKDLNNKDNGPNQNNALLNIPRDLLVEIFHYLPKGSEVGKDYKGLVVNTNYKDLDNFKNTIEKLLAYDDEGTSTEYEVYNGVSNTVDTMGGSALNYQDYYD